jgi:hypothetical protein
MREYEKLKAEQAASSEDEAMKQAMSYLEGQKK